MFTNVTYWLLCIKCTYIFISTYFNQEIIKQTQGYIKLSYLNITQLIEKLISIYILATKLLYYIILHYIIFLFNYVLSDNTAQLGETRALINCINKINCYILNTVVIIVYYVKRN
jgi:hypothetical protein